MEVAYASEPDEYRYEDMPRAPSEACVSPRECYQSGYDGGAQDGVSDPVDQPDAVREGSFLGAVDAQEK